MGGWLGDICDENIVPKDGTEGPGVGKRLELEEGDE